MKKPAIAMIHQYLVRVVFFAGISFGGVQAYAQKSSIKQSKEHKIEDREFRLVEEPAYFPGGMNAFYQLMGRKLKFPKEVKKGEVSGKVLVKFTIAETGEIPDESIIIVQSLCPSCDAAVIEFMKECPDWVPGKQQGVGVPVTLKLPVNFN